MKAVCLLYFLKVTAGFTVTAPSRLSSHAFDSLPFYYFGPQTFKLLAPAIVLDGEALCRPSSTSVTGKIVIIGDWDGPTCDLGSLAALYDIVSDAGASALVFTSHLHFFPPGSIFLYEDEWNMGKRHSQRTMPMIHLGGLALESIPAWRGEPDLEVLLEPPATNALVEQHRSWYWTLLMRVIFPLAAFATSFIALTEIRRVWKLYLPNTAARERESRQVSFLVCCIEAPAMLVFGTALACGLYGPTSIPTRFVYCIYTTCNGCGTFATFVLALHLNEECRNLFVFGHRRRSTVRHFRRTLIAVGSVSVLADVVAAVLSIFYFFLVLR